MNTPSNAMPESSRDRTNDSQRMAPVAVPEIRPWYWSIRRELWEYRSIYIAPLAAAAVVLLGVLLSVYRLPHRMRVVLAPDPLQQMQQRVALDMPYHIATALIMGTSLIVAVFYCLDTLHGERRDRSILFWKSLPLSDSTTVLSKALVPIVILQLLSWAIVTATLFLIMLLEAMVLAGSGMSAAPLWTQSSLPRMSLMLLYHLLTVHGLWYAPLYCWLLLISVWARRAPFLWAFLPPLAVTVVEKIAFNTSHFGNLLKRRLSGGPESLPMASDRFPISANMHITPGNFLTSPGLWLGLLSAAGFLFAATRLRRYREPM